MPKNWADLPAELIQEIAGKHTNYVDFLSTRAVCKSWQSAISKRPHSPLSQLPFLLLPYHRQNSGHRGFYNTADGKIYSLNLPEASEKRYCGSSNGWLIMVEESPSIFLLNPLTRAEIELPSLSNFPIFPTDVVFLNSRSLNENFIAREKLHIRDTFIVKAVLSADPSIAADFSVAVIHGFNENLAHCRSGGGDWKIIDPPRRYKDALFRNGKLYAVDQSGGIPVFNQDLNSMIRIADPPPVNPRVGFRQWYLASCDGEDEMLVIGRYRKVVPDYEYKTERFEAYSHDLESNRWKRKENLGEKTVFLGSNSSLCISAADYSTNCKGNCIYFTDDYMRLSKDYAFEGHDFGVFDFEDGRTRSLELASYPVKQPILPQILYFELNLRRETALFVLPPPIWVTVSP